MGRANIDAAHAAAARFNMACVVYDPVNRRVIVTAVPWQSHRRMATLHQWEDGTWAGRLVCVADPERHALVMLPMLGPAVEPDEQAVRAAVAHVLANL